ncbi:MAG: sulfotransferase, partial [Actinobacteria bacterium]|nr:sulfotransferase [Actinomycetota bacterium]
MDSVGEAMLDERVKVLFIAGSGRSGSTLLANMLGQLDGYFSAGELRYLFERGVIENRLCGCGAHFRECRLWTAVADRAFGGMDERDAGQAVSRQHRCTRARHLPLMLAARWAPDRFSSRMAGYPEQLSRLYRAVREVTGSRVIVDSSKLPTYGYILGKAPAVDLSVVHLVRDPRAVAYSWTRKKAQPDRGWSGYMQPQAPVKSALLWNLWNASAAAMWGQLPRRYLLLRYEDFIDEPKESMGRILAMMGDDEPALSFLDGRRVTLLPNHTVAGNPDR